MPADPQAWYVNVSNRSNQQKDAVTAYHGLTAVLEACGGEKAAEILRKNIAANLEFPLHREVARLLDDSNMLVFPNNESFASWIRAQTIRGSAAMLSSRARLPSRSDFRTRNGAFSRAKGAITARTYPRVALQHPLLEIPSPETMPSLR